MPVTQLASVAICCDDDLVCHQRTATCFQPQTILTPCDGTGTNIAEQLHTRIPRDIQDATMELARMNRS